MVVWGWLLLQHVLTFWIACFSMDKLLTPSKQVTNVLFHDPHVQQVVVANNMITTGLLCLLQPDLYVTEYFSVLKFIVVVLSQEFLFYVTHSIAHLPFFFKNFHYVHHRVVVTQPISAFYAHPLEHIVCNVFPVVFPAYMVGLSYWEWVIWILAVDFYAIRSHSEMYASDEWYCDHYAHHHLSGKHHLGSRLMTKLFAVN